MRGVAVIFFLFSKRDHTIKKAAAKTVSEFADRMPKIYQHFFYVASDIGPRKIVIWYLFETDAELESAKSSGYCDELEKTTIRNLISLGYPQEAFELTQRNTPKIEFHGGTEEEHQKILHSLTYRKAMISFMKRGFAT